MELKEIYPAESNIIEINGSSIENHTALIRLKCTTKEEFQSWLSNHADLSSVTFRVLATSPTVGKNVLYSASYRCQHNTYPKSHKRVKKPHAKHTGCEAKLHVSVKSSVKGRRVRSKDNLRAEFPTIVKVYHKHNHLVNDANSLRFRKPSEAVKLKFLELFKNNYTPSKALKLHKTDLLQEYQDEYYKVEADRSICPDLSWVFRLYYSIKKNQLMETNTISPDTADFSPNENENAIKIDHASCPVAEEIIVGDLSECHVVMYEDIKEKCCDFFERLRLGLERCPSEYIDAIYQFHSDMTALDSDESFLFALRNFGKPVLPESKSFLVPGQRVVIINRDSISLVEKKNSSTDHEYSKNGNTTTLE